MNRNLLSLIGLVVLLGSITTLNAQTYVTSEACKGCHAKQYDTWKQSGHPYKFSKVENNQAPNTWPSFVKNFKSTWTDSIGKGDIKWADIAGVVGGFGWKARFVGKDGHFIGTAGSSFPKNGRNQINFFDGEFTGWSNYNTTTNTVYNYACFKCHTTGGTKEGTWLPGVDGLGTFTESGVGCESCHGPGSAHIASPTKATIDRVYEQAHIDNASGGMTIKGVVQKPSATGNDVNFMCGTCHGRSYNDKIEAKSGFMDHRVQWDGFMASKHAEIGFSCTTCHDPHKRVLYGGDGIKKTCESCHTTQTSKLNHAKGVTCLDCHMPYASLSGSFKRGKSGFKGDDRSHFMAINTSTASMFNAAGDAVLNDATRKASLSPHFACLGCHNDSPTDNIKDMTIEDASKYAIGMHKTTGVNDLFSQQMALNVYPNPARSLNEVNFNLTLAKSDHVSLRIFNTSGEVVYAGTSEFKIAGSHNINLSLYSAAAVPPGVYYVNVRSAEMQTTQKFFVVW